MSLSTHKKTSLVMIKENIILVNLSKRKNNSKKLLFLLNSIGLKEQNFNNSILKSRKKILILDGILGIGISRKPEGLIEKTIKLINKVKKKFGVTLQWEIKIIGSNNKYRKYFNE